jgi:hypothetical protein
MTGKQDPITYLALGIDIRQEVLFELSFIEYIDGMLFHLKRRLIGASLLGCNCDCVEDLQ